MVKEKLETVIPIIESGLIYDILLQEQFSEDIDNYKTILGLDKRYAYMMSIVCGDEQIGNHMTNAVGSSVKMQQHYQEVRECVKDYFDCIVGTVMSNKLAVLVPCDKDCVDYNERIGLIEKTRELVRRMRQKTGINFRIGIGRAGVLQEMAGSYEEALNALLMTTGSVAHADDLPIGCDYAEDYPIHLEKKLFDELEKGEIDNVYSTAKKFFHWMTESNAKNIMSIRLKTLEFALYAEHIAYRKGGMTYHFTSRQEYLPTIMNMDDLDSLARMVFREDYGRLSKYCRKKGRKVQQYYRNGGGIHQR